MLAVEIAMYLDAEGVGVFDASGVSGNIFIGKLPDAPDAAIAIFQSGGGRGDGTQHYNPTIQVITRSSQNPATSYALAEEVSSKLEYFHDGSFVPGGEHVVFCEAIQSAPATIGPDDKKREQYSQNFEFIVSKRHEN